MGDPADVLLHKKWYEPFRDLIYVSPHTYALRKLDHKILKHVTRRFGFFVEAGANDGIQQSNTLYFEKHRNWRGILIEPDPALASRCRKTRIKSITVEAALVAPADSGKTVSFTSMGLMGHVHGSFKTEGEAQSHVRSAGECFQPSPKPIHVRGLTLTEILVQHSVKKIDLLILDVEGYEAQALSGLEFAKYKPEFILVEARYPDEIHAILSDKYTLKDKLTERDWLYCLK